MLNKHQSRKCLKNIPPLLAESIKGLVGALWIFIPKYHHCSSILVKCSTTLCNEERSVPKINTNNFAFKNGYLPQLESLQVTSTEPIHHNQRVCALQ